MPGAPALLHGEFIFGEQAVHESLLQRRRILDGDDRNLLKAVAEVRMPERFELSLEPWAAGALCHGHRGKRSRTRGKGRDSGALSAPEG